MYNDLFSIGPVTVHMYGVMTGLGILAAYWLASVRAKEKNLTETAVDKIFGLVIACVAVGYLCSKILYIITIFPHLLDGTMSLRNAITGGWVVIGGLLGGILGAWLYCKWNKLDLWIYFDVAFPGVALAQALGRIGCFFAGCCYGKETTGPLYIMFTHSDFGPNNVHLIPTQLIMSAGDFLLVLALVFYGKKLQKKEGEIAGLYLMLYSLGRFCVEFLRGDVLRGQVGVLSTSQFIGLFTAFGGVLLFLYARKRTETPREKLAGMIKSADVKDTEIRKN
ncbi:MAG: prolipoprotein diacylglyceryl transferase [Eubacteriales bacterium]|nr:prolipoprotein diacylglyceryl transferase [Eubacteriales bacterium]